MVMGIESREWIVQFVLSDIIRLDILFRNLIVVLLIASSSLRIAEANSLIGPENVAVVVNQSDPQSVEVGNYYIRARNIPPENLVNVTLPKGEPKLSLPVFTKMKEQVINSLDSKIQVIVMVWTTPYAVECNSITSAMTMGFDPDQCSNLCGVGKQSPYFDSPSNRPLKDYGMRLSMLLPIESVDKAKALIDRGVLSSFKLNEASAYFVKTSDKTRSAPREAFYPKVEKKIPSKMIDLIPVEADSIADKHDIMFYLTGTVNVPNLDTLTFLPGALADHLTSAGGDLMGTGQMTVLKWLDAGATASYGTVTEPCNYWQKFPNPLVLLTHYLSGETAIEAYWKSVAWPAQGLFVGEPLAAPYQPRGFR